MSAPTEVFTTSNVFLDVLVKAGIRKAFVNLGSDHPALLEAFASRKKYGLPSLDIVTCPNEVRPCSYESTMMGRADPLSALADGRPLGRAGLRPGLRSPGRRHRARGLRDSGASLPLGQHPLERTKS